MNTSEDYRKMIEYRNRAMEVFKALTSSTRTNFRDKNRRNRSNRRWKKLSRRRSNRGRLFRYQESIINPWWLIGMNVIQEPLLEYFEKRKMEFGSTQPKEQ